VSALACEYGRFLTNSPCVLSPQITSIQRDGVSFEVSVPAKNGDKGAPTGVARADAWLRSINPAGLRRRPRVESPDLDVSRRTTATYP